MYLDNRKLIIMMAQEKGEVEQKQKEREKKEPKDNRNLYLAREGIIREGIFFIKLINGVSSF